MKEIAMILKASRPPVPGLLRSTLLWITVFWAASIAMAPLALFSIMLPIMLLPPAGEEFGVPARLIPKPLPTQ